MPLAVPLKWAKRTSQLDQMVLANVKQLLHSETLALRQALLQLVEVFEVAFSFELLTLFFLGLLETLDSGPPADWLSLEDDDVIFASVVLE